MKKLNLPMRTVGEKIKIEKQRRSKLEKGVMKRRQIRDDIRKKIAEREGVNWKRVVLTSKVEKRKEPAYIIKR